MENFVLQVKDLNISYTDEAHHLFGANRKKSVCKNITFSIHEGEIVGLLGKVAAVNPHWQRQSPI